MPASESIQFVFSENEIDRKNGRLSPWAFTPRPEAGRLRKSTCIDNNLTNDDTWGLGERVRSYRQSRSKGRNQLKLLGRADMKGLTYSGRGLDFEPAPSATVPEHVNIIGWEQAALDLQSHHEQIALLISLESLFIPVP